MSGTMLKLVSGMALVLPCAALAWNEVYWDAADGAFTEASNWRDGTAPTSAASLVRVANDGIMRISSDFTFSPAIRVGFSAGTGTVIQTGGAVSATTAAGIQGNNTFGIGNENMSDTATGESLWRISAGSLTSTYYAQIGQYGRGALVSTGPFDARGLVVELEEGTALVPGHNYTIATFPPNAFTGPFAGATLPNGWKLRVNEAVGTVKLSSGGCAIIIR